MKKLLFLGIIIFLTIKITLYFNKKQAQKLIEEKTSTSKTMNDKEIKDMTKAMHNYEYLKTKIRKDLKKKVHIKASEVKPVYQNRSNTDVKNLNNYENSYRYNDYNSNYYYNDEEDDKEYDDENNEEDSYKEEEEEEDYYSEEYDEDRKKPSIEAIKKIRSIKNLINSRLNRNNNKQVEGNINQDYQDYEENEDRSYDQDYEEEY